MASGKVHARISFEYGTIIAGCIGGAVSIQTGSLMPVLLVVSGNLIGIVMNPDLDQQSISHLEYRILKYTLGLGAIWIGFWYPYSLLIPHRHNLSHFPGLGGLVRLVYLSVAIIPILWYLQLGILPIHILWIWVGVTISDTLHWVYDGFPI